jgi:glycine cleavage system protein P-like pyridoxal-binding family
LRFVGEQRNGGNGGNLRGFDSCYEESNRSAVVKSFYIEIRLRTGTKILFLKLTATVSHELIADTSNGDDQFGPFRIFL